MWVLLNNLQFFLFIGMWKVNYPKYSRTIFEQLTKIALGQYIDDLEIGAKVSAVFGMESSENGPEDKQGTERMGSKSLLSNLGITILLVCIGLVIIVLVVLCLKTYRNRSKLS